MSKMHHIMLATAAVIIVGSAVVHGVMTDRWIKRHSEKLTQYTARLEQVPTQFGDWESTPDTVDPAEFKASGCDGHFSRVFTNKVTKDQISVFLVSGRGYHVTIHTPDFCYKAAGYDQRAQEEPYSFQAPGVGDKIEVAHALFKKDTPTETSQLRILWNFTVDGTWRSPEVPKLTYGGEDAMYKLYLIRNTGGRVPEIGDDPVVSFANEFVPLVNQVLFTDASVAAESTPVTSEENASEG